MKAIPRVLITGGAGFVGTNLGSAYLRDGCRVKVLDNLGRPGVDANLDWLNSTYPHSVEFLREDVRDSRAVAFAAQGVDIIFHFAAQVAVTTSLTDPREDCEVNVGGTLNVLEAARRSGNRPIVVFTSTNKVYGDLASLPLVSSALKVEPADAVLRASGVDETQPLDFHSPYGCSKGSADQYVRDYARHFGIPTVVFRMSCICGAHQQGTEDQGWVAHFVRSALRREPLTIYGDGKQVRDLLCVDDLVRAFRMIDSSRGSHLYGEVFNMGGGSANAASVNEVLKLIERETDIPIERSFGQARAGDQRWYVSNPSKFKRVTGWRPQSSLKETIRQLVSWVAQSQGTIASAEENNQQCALL